MAIGAVAKGYSCVARLFVRTRSVALLASDLGMRAREWITCKRMVELADTDSLPIAGVVTLQAIGPEPAVVLVLMTGDATRRNAQKCPGQILDLDVRALALGYALGRMTLVATLPGVFAFEPPAGLGVVESFEVPLCQCEVFAVVIGVASDAFQARTHLDVVSSVQSSSRFNAPRNFGVAIQAFERGLSG